MANSIGKTGEKIRAEKGYFRAYFKRKFGRGKNDFATCEFVAPPAVFTEGVEDLERRGYKQVGFWKWNAPTSTR